MKRNAYVITGAAATGLVLAGVVLAGGRVLNQSTEPAAIATSYPLDVEPRPGECVTVSDPSYASTARGAAAPLAALRNVLSNPAAFRERAPDVNARVFERFEGRRKVAAYLVRKVQGSEGGWLLTKSAYSWPCGAEDPAIPPPGRDPIEPPGQHRGREATGP